MERVKNEFALYRIGLWIFPLRNLMKVKDFRFKVHVGGKLAKIGIHVQGYP